MAGIHFSVSLTKNEDRLRAVADFMIIVISAAETLKDTKAALNVVISEGLTVNEKPHNDPQRVCCQVLHLLVL